MDTQGLLDRIFPLPTEHTSDSGSSAGPSTGTQSYSFRALLKTPSKYPLRVLRCAVQHLFPISSLPRSRPSAPAAEQLRFCQLALSLLDQASLHSCPVPLDTDSLIPSTHDRDNEQGQTPQSVPSPTDRGLKRHKYALLQRLPNGDWWSSVNSSYPSLAADGKELKDLPTSYAELVAILPSASASTADPVTLGDYVKKRSYKPIPIPQERKLTCGTFLDYGPYASFAPTFEQNGKEVGRVGVGGVVWFKEKDRYRRARIRAYREHLLSRSTEEMPQAGVQEEAEVNPDRASSKHKGRMTDEDLDILDGLLTPEQVANVKSAAGSLELEDAISELLARNARALERLDVLQLERLSNKDPGPKDVEVGSEEWDTAHGILDSLALLASLRPRSSSDTDTAPLIPSASVLRRLHRTLPHDSTQGWYGTLPEARATACRDDMTVKVKAGASIPVQAPAPPAALVSTPTTAVSTPVTAKPTAPTYTNHSYSSYTTPYRGTYGTYTPQNSTNYYPNYQSSVASTAQTSTASHYPNHQYNSTNQQPYSAYSSWYNYQPPANTAGNSSNAALGQTPVKPTNYGGYYSNTQQPQPQRAVANTVLTAGSAASKTYPGSWTNGSAYVPPTLPTHMRSAASAASSAPGTPQPGPPVTSTATSYAGYYNAYQPSSTPTPAAAQ